MVREIVARIERSEIRGRWLPHFAALNAGYEATNASDAIACPGRGAALRPGHGSCRDALLRRVKNQPSRVVRIRSIVSGLLFTMKTATRTCEPSARGAEPAFVIAGHSVLKTRVRRYRVSRMRCSASVSEAVQR